MKGDMLMSFLYFLEGIRCGFFDAFFSVVTLFGEETLFMAFGMIIFWCVDKYKGYYVLCVGFLGTVINQFLKMLFRVPRPWVADPNFTIVESAREAATGYSFPSGHTQTAVGLYGGIARISGKRYIILPAVALCVLIPLSRMYLGVHTPADVLVSTLIALLLVFGAYPFFMRAKEKPRIMYVLISVLLVLVVAFLLFICFYEFPSSCYLAENIHNLESARKNGFTLLGCLLGLIVTYTIDTAYVKFETKAVFWVQIIKVVVGILLVLAVKELLRAPLEALFNGTLVARAVRYFLMVVVGGLLWPMCFSRLSKLGKKESEDN